MSSNSSTTLASTLGTGVSAAPGLGLASAQLTFDDEFAGFTSSTGATGWRTLMPYYGATARTLPTGETDYYSDSTVGVNPFTDNGGVLTITSTRATPSASNNYQPWTSGLIQSQYLATQTYGYFEAGINVTSAAGFWPSFWLTSVDPTYLGEIDAAEILTANDHQIYNTTHVVTTSGDKVATLTQVSLPTDLSQGYHAIGVDWEPDYVTWYIDGVVSSRQPTANYGLDKPMYMVLVQAVGGWAGNPAASTGSAPMNVDYVRAYATANTVSVAGSGVIKTGAVAGTVQLGSGTGLVNVGVTLLDAAGQLVATAKTNATGGFGFGGLAAGSYRLLYAAPTGYVPASGSAADPITGLTGTFAVADGQTATVPAEKLSAGSTAAIAGTVVLQLVAGTNPIALSGVAVSLSSGGTTVATTLTDASGKYLFTNISAGNYTLKYTPQHYKSLASGPADPDTGLTGTIAAIAGTTVTVPAEIVTATPGSLSGTVVFDRYGDGTVTTGQGGVTVSAITAAGAVLASTVTDANGAYVLDGLPPGNTYIRVTTPTGELLSSSVDEATGTTKQLVAPGRNSFVPTIALRPAGTILNGASFSGLVLLGTAGLAGVTASLVDAMNATVATTTTDAAGAYRFGGLSAGNYSVQFTPPAGTVLQAGGPSGIYYHVNSAQSFPMRPEFLSGTPTVQTTATITGSVLDDGIGPGAAVVSLLAGSTTVATTKTAVGGAFTFANVPPGTYRLSFAAPAGTVLLSGPDGSTVTVAAGQTLALSTQNVGLPAARIGGTLLAGTAAVTGRMVTLYNQAGQAIATTTTNPAGGFDFLNLTAGVYGIGFVPRPGEALQSGDPADTTTGQTAPIALGAGQSSILPPEHLLPAPVSLTALAYATVSRGDGNYTVSAPGPLNRATVALGDGTQSVTFSGWAGAVTLGNGNQTVTLTGNQMRVQTGNGAQALTLSSDFSTAAIGDTPRYGTSTIQLGGGHDAVTGGNGNVTVNGPSGSGYNTVTLGNGNDTVMLAGSYDTVTVGAGASTLTVGTTGSYYATVKAGGAGSSGSVTVNVAGKRSVVDVGPGTTFINATAAGATNTFVVNGKGQGLTTIGGFSVGSDTLDLTRTLAGTNIGTDVTQVGKYVTASAVNNGADTLLSVDPSGGAGTPYGFALLSGVQTTVANLIAKHDFALH